MNDQSQKILDQLWKSMEKPTPEALYHQLGRLRRDALLDGVGEAFHHQVDWPSACGG